MTPAMIGAIFAISRRGPLVKGRSGWVPAGSDIVAYTTRTVEALVDRRFVEIEGNIEKWGAEAKITIAGLNWVDTHLAHDGAGA